MALHEEGPCNSLTFAWALFRATGCGGWRTSKAPKGHSDQGVEWAGETALPKRETKAGPARSLVWGRCRDCNGLLYGVITRAIRAGVIRAGSRQLLANVVLVGVWVGVEREVNRNGRGGGSG